AKSSATASQRINGIGKQKLASYLMLTEIRSEEAINCFTQRCENEINYVYSPTLDTEGSPPCEKLQSKDYNCNPGMVVSQIVAAAPRTKLKGIDPARSKNHICARPVRSCRTFEEPTVEISGHPYSSIKELSEWAKQLAKNVVSLFYKAKSE
ncbi:31045_t:CDS:2, partial [Racocetra persica]